MKARTLYWRTSLGRFGEPENGSANLIRSELGERLYFANLVRAVRRTATKLCSGSKTLRSTCSGNYLSGPANLASDWLKLESSPAEEEETRTAKHGGVDILSLRRKSCEEAALSGGPGRKGNIGLYVHRKSLRLIKDGEVAGQEFYI